MYCQRGGHDTTRHDTMMIRLWWLQFILPPFPAADYFFFIWLKAIRVRTRRTTTFEIKCNLSFSHRLSSRTLDRGGGKRGAKRGDEIERGSGRWMLIRSSVISSLPTVGAKLNKPVSVSLSDNRLRAASMPEKKEEEEEEEENTFWTVALLLLLQLLSVVFKEDHVIDGQRRPLLPGVSVTRTHRRRCLGLFNLLLSRWPRLGKQNNNQNLITSPSISFYIFLSLLVSARWRRLGNWIYFISLQIEQEEEDE